MQIVSRRDARAALLVLALGVATLLAAAALHAQPGAALAVPDAERCEAMRGGESAEALVARAIAAAGAGARGGTRLHARYGDVVSHRYESDRMYPPSLTYVHTGDLWVDPAMGVQRTEEQMLGGGGVYRTPALVVSATATLVARGDSLVPVPQLHAVVGTHARRALDPWTVLADWRDATDARVVGRCLYRERWRTVIARPAPAGAFTVGEERLYLDPRSGLVVKLDRRERDALWGAVRAEYLYTNWDYVGARGGAGRATADGPRYPIAVARLVDGAVDMARSIGGVELVPADSTPRLVATSAVPTMATWRDATENPDTVRVGEHAFLLVARGYTSMVALAHDTVVVLDATVGEARARQDSSWIARLFPGSHPVRVVVTDLAWPHIAGVRFWVARGATIVSHRDSRPFLAQVVARRWADAPDALERLRASSPASARLRFVAVDDTLRLAGGAVRLFGVDGYGSEGALAAYLPDARFLWAGDYIQSVRGPTAYASEVIAAAARHAVTPERVAAMHLRPTAWATVVSAQRASGPATEDVR